MIELRETHEIKFNEMIKLEFRMLDINIELYCVDWEKRSITFKWYLSKGIEIKMYDNRETELTLPFVISEYAYSFSYEIPFYSGGYIFPKSKQQIEKIYSEKYRFSATFTYKTIKEVANL